MHRDTSRLVLRVIAAIVVFLVLAWAVGLVLRILRWLVVLALAVGLGVFIAREASRRS